MQLDAFGVRVPKLITCPNCGQQVSTRIQYESGVYTWLIGFLICVITQVFVFYSLPAELVQGYHPQMPQMWSRSWYCRVRNLLIIYIIMDAIDEVKQFLYTNTKVSEQHNSMDIMDLLELCENRVRCYKKVDLHLISSDRSHETMKNLSKIYGDMLRARSNSVKELRDFYELDKVAHFFLELVYAETEQKIIEFAGYERALFECRLKNIQSGLIRLESICEGLKIPIRKITNKEWELYGEQMQIAVGNSKKQKADEYNRTQAMLNDQNNYFRVPYQWALKSVGNIRVFLKQGWAYIFKEELIKNIFDVFQDNMIARMTKLNKSANYRNNIESDERLAELIRRIPNVDNMDQWKAGGQISLQHSLSFVNIKEFSFVSFPLCMKYLYDKLQENSHLKHMGRLQLQLFQKSASMPVQDCLAFWKFSFSRKYTDVQFEKEYSYNIRHSYGLEGKRADYGSRSCSNILQQIPGNEEYNGCPFKVFSEDILCRYLKVQGIDENSIDKIVAFKKGNHFQVACKEMWLSKHPKSKDEFVMSNPVDYYKNSRLYYVPDI